MSSGEESVPEARGEGVGVEDKTRGDLDEVGLIRTRVRAVVAWQGHHDGLGNRRTSSLTSWWSGRRRRQAETRGDLELRG
jgi:hypothetical protein